MGHTPERRAHVADGVRRAWEEGKFPRKHPADCGHCLAVRGRAKPPRSQAHRDAISAQKRLRDPSYGSMHWARLRRDRGRADSHRCTQCGNRATPAEFLRSDELGRVWSVRTEDYAPMCRSCHKLLDNARAAA